MSHFAQEIYLVDLQKNVIIIIDIEFFSCYKKYIKVSHLSINFVSKNLEKGEIFVSNRLDLFLFNLFLHFNFFFHTCLRAWRTYSRISNIVTVIGRRGKGMLSGTRQVDGLLKKCFSYYFTMIFHLVRSCCEK